MTIDEFAADRKVGRETVLAWIRAGKLPPGCFLLRLTPEDSQRPRYDVLVTYPNTEESK